MNTHTQIRRVLAHTMTAAVLVVGVVAPPLVRAEPSFATCPTTTSGCTGSGSMSTCACSSASPLPPVGSTETFKSVRWELSMGSPGFDSASLTVDAPPTDPQNSWYPVAYVPLKHKATGEPGSMTGVTVTGNNTVFGGCTVAVKKAKLIGASIVLKFNNPSNATSFGIPTLRLGAADPGLCNL